MRWSAQDETPSDDRLSGRTRFDRSLSFPAGGFFIIDMEAEEMRIVTVIIIGLAFTLMVWDASLHAIGLTMFEGGACSDLDLPWLLWPCFDDRTAYDTFWMLVHLFAASAIPLALYARR
jgi:hypothetical protein